jgi:hypothetical protein
VMTMLVSSMARPTAGPGPGRRLQPAIPHFKIAVRPASPQLSTWARLTRRVPQQMRMSSKGRTPGFGTSWMSAPAGYPTLNCSSPNVATISSRPPIAVT